MDEDDFLYVGNAIEEATDPLYQDGGGQGCTVSFGALIAGAGVLVIVTAVMLCSVLSLR